MCMAMEDPLLKVLSLQLKHAASGFPIDVRKFLKVDEWSNDFNPFLEQQRRRELMDLIADGTLVIDDPETEEEVRMEEGKEGLRLRRPAE